VGAALVAAGIAGVPKPGRAAPPARTATTSTSTPKPPPSYRPAPDGPLGSDAKQRPRPDLGPSPPAPTLGEALLWVPRILFSPVYALTEFAIRRPVGFVVTELEKTRAWEVVIDIFTFDERRIGVVPTFFVQFDLRSSVGVYVFWNDFLLEGNDLRSNFAFGGERWWLFSLRDRLRLEEGTELEVGFEFLQRPDQIFAGTGHEIEVENASRFLRRTIAGRASLRHGLWRRSELRWSGRVAENRFDGDSAGFGDPALVDAVALGFHRAPEGLDPGYTVLAQAVRVRVDSRPQGLRASGTGISAETRFELAADVAGPDGAEWMTFGGRIGGFWDLGSNHTLGLSTRLESQTRLGDEPVPFTELSRPGSGPFEMSGFTPGVLRGHSSILATFEYRYPVWVLVDGSLHVSAGNVFDELSRDFRWDRLRLSFGLGLRSSDRDNPFTLVLAFGTRTIASGTEVESVRVAFGTGP